MIKPNVPRITYRHKTGQTSVNLTDESVEFLENQLFKQKISRRQLTQDCLFSEKQLDNVFLRDDHKITLHALNKMMDYLGIEVVYKELKE